jgi:hypothetical protein
VRQGVARGQATPTRRRARRSASSLPHRGVHPGAKLPAAAAAVDRRFEDDEADFQRHHRSARPGREPYAYYAPAYRYGYALATEPRYAGRDWSTIETEAWRDWEARHRGQWDEFKDAVYYGWEYVRGRHHTDEGDVRIPNVKEAIHVETRQVERGGVKIYSHMTEQPVEQEVHLRDERVTVERRPVDRPATERDLAAFKEGTIEVTETHAELVVNKQARMVEEVVIDRTAWCSL